MDVFNDKQTSNYISKFVCVLCDFNCCKKGDWNRHIVTTKHKVTNDVKGHNICDTKTPYICDVCDKKYLSRNGLWVHKKTCKKPEVIPTIIQPPSITNDLLMVLIKDNMDMKQIIIDQSKEQAKEMRNLLIDQAKEKEDLKQLIIEVVKNSNNTINNNTNTNSLNKTFNLQFFLNETCKDAMNIMDFVNTIQIQLSDLEKMGEIGYVQGLSNIITSNLKTLDFTQRPVHCMDQKRETIYIKDENKWEKEDDNKTKLRKIINRIAFKNIKLLPQFREKYPDYGDSSLKISDIYDKLVLEAMGGIGGNEINKENKIIHNISKCILVDK